MIHGVEDILMLDVPAELNRHFAVPSLRNVSQKSLQAHQKLASRQNRDFAGDYQTPALWNQPADEPPTP
jgi:hypothetical protein